MIVFNFKNNSNKINPDSIVLNFYEDNKILSESIIVSQSLYHYLTKSKQKIDNNVLEWDYYKKVTNPYEFIHTPPVNYKKAVAEYTAISRSFFKLIEIVVYFDLLSSFFNKNIKSFHLAEGPGGFIEAMIFIRKRKEDLYYGMTLICEDSKNIPKWNKLRNKFKFNTSLNYEYGATGNGDLLHQDNFVHCVKKYKNSMDFITGDGGFDFSLDYEKQEVSSTKLVFAQIMYAIMLQSFGGNFVLKIFDIFHKSTIDLLYLLNTFYSEVIVCKPKTSRFANSEKYIICKNFLLHDSSMYYEIFLNIFKTNNDNKDKNISSILSFDLPLFFIREIEELNCIFGKKQLNTIHNTMLMIQEKRIDKIEKIRKANIEKCIQWCSKNNIPCNSIFKPQNIFTKHSNKNNTIIINRP